MNAKSPWSSRANGTQFGSTMYPNFPVGEAHIQFHFQYYMFAILFVVFDLVVVFLMLWVLVYTSLDTSAKLVMFLFVGMTLLALYYALKKEEVIWI